MEPNTPFGTTATQVSPEAPQKEDAMSVISRMFSQASDAIVKSSQLVKDMNAELVSDMAKLRKELDGLKSDLEYVRAKNKELDQHLYEVREQRDKARTELEQARNDASKAKLDNEVMVKSLQDHNATIDNLKADVARLIKERDDYAKEAIEALNKADTAEAKLAQIREGYAAIFGEAKAEPAPEPTRAVNEPVVAPTPEPDNYYTKPVEPVQPEPTSPVTTDPYNPTRGW